MKAASSAGYNTHLNDDQQNTFHGIIETQGWKGSTRSSSPTIKLGGSTEI